MPFQPRYTPGSGTVATDRPFRQALINNVARRTCRLPMSSHLLLRFVFCVAPLSWCGCEATEPRLAQPEMDPAAAGVEALREYDTDHDSAIAGAELEKCPGLKSGLPLIDKDGDGRLTAAEISA